MEIAFLHSHFLQAAVPGQFISEALNKCCSMYTDTICGIVTTIHPNTRCHRNGSINSETTGLYEFTRVISTKGTWGNVWQVAMDIEWFTGLCPHRPRFRSVICGREPAIVTFDLRHFYWPCFGERWLSCGHRWHKGTSDITRDSTLIY